MSVQHHLPWVRGLPQHTEVLSKNWRFKFSSTGLGMSLGTFRESCGARPVQNRSTTILGSGVIWANYSDLLTRGWWFSRPGFFSPRDALIGPRVHPFNIPRVHQGWEKVFPSPEDPVVMLMFFWRFYADSPKKYVQIVSKDGLDFGQLEGFIS